MVLQPQPDPPVVARQPGNVMRTGAHVPWFNPREMDDETVLMLNTGREELLAQFFKAVGERLAHPGVYSHWLLTGTRGAGKSFFLRLVQTTFAGQVGAAARFVLLPEEHRNIYAPHEFLAEVRRMLDGNGAGAAPAWRVADPGKAWDDALAALLAAFDGPLLVIGVENFDQLIAQAFSDPADNARLRHLMSNEPRLMLCASAVQGDFDENYDQRLFRQFEHHPMPRWDAADHRDYLTRRAQRAGKRPSSQQLARIDAYSRYTGGNPRAAAVLAGTILDDDDPLQSASDLDAAIEKMSDYYRALIERIPPNTRKLFDALIRGGEPASQSEIAARSGARQNDIARAFLWLVDQGYVGETRLPGEKTKQYRVLDRLFVQFYRMRSITPGQRSRLAMMAELLADTLAFGDKWRYARQYEGDGQEPDRAAFEHRRAYEKGGASDSADSAAWNLSQLEQVTAYPAGVEAAWAILDGGITKVEDFAITAIRQLGDAVSDCVQRDGEAAAFALACAILEGLAARPQYSAEAALRGLWIDMVEMSVPHGLLRDLLGEWPRLFGARFGAELAELAQLLEAWLDDLDTPPDARVLRRQRLDPDLATTLGELSAALPSKVRRRLGLMEDSGEK